MSTVNSSLQKLRQLAPSLNQAADNAAKVVQEVEALLTKELNLGVESGVNVAWTNVTPKKTRFLQLCHRRVNGKFRLAVVEATCTSFTDDDNTLAEAWKDDDVTPWAECPRDVKLKTFPALPMLLQTLIDKVEETNAEVEKTKQTVREILGMPKTATNVNPIPSGGYPVPAGAQPTPNRAPNLVEPPPRDL